MRPTQSHKPLLEGSDLGDIATPESLDGEGLGNIIVTKLVPFEDGEAIDLGS